MDEKGNISFVLVFFFIAIAVTFMFVVLAPGLQTFIARVYQASEPLIEDANTTAGTFTDPQVKSIYQTSLQGQKDSLSFQQEVLSTLNTYAWLIVVILTALIFLIFSRFLVERSVGIV